MTEIDDWKYQGLFWRGEQLFAPTSSLEDLELFLRFVRLFEQHDIDRVSKFVFENDLTDESYAKYYLSTLSPENESEEDFSVRKHNLILASSEMAYPPAEFSRYKYVHDGDFGFKQRKDEALVWLERAAKHGHCEALGIYGEYLLATKLNVSTGSRYTCASKYLCELRGRSNSV